MLNNHSLGVFLHFLVKYLAPFDSQTGEVFCATLCTMLSLTTLEVDCRLCEMEYRGRRPDCRIDIISMYRDKSINQETERSHWLYGLFAIVCVMSLLTFRLSDPIDLKSVAADNRKDRRLQECTYVYYNYEQLVAHEIKFFYAELKLF